MKGKSTFSTTFYFVKRCISNFRSWFKWWYLRKSDILMYIWVYIHLYIDLENVGSLRIDSPPEFSSLYRCPNVSIRRGVEGNASNTSISAVCLRLTFSPPPFYPPYRFRPPWNTIENLLALLIHSSVYLSLWFALVSRSQVSLINFVASLCGAGGIQAFKTMRTLRALRPLRAMSRMQGMRVCNPPSQQTLSLAIYVCRWWRQSRISSPPPTTARHSTYPSVLRSVPVPVLEQCTPPFDYVYPANTPGETVFLG